MEDQELLDLYSNARSGKDMIHEEDELHLIGLRAIANSSEEQYEDEEICDPSDCNLLDEKDVEVEGLTEKVEELKSEMSYLENENNDLTQRNDDLEGEVENLRKSNEANT